jgi:hypothetical protein
MMVALAAAPAAAQPVDFDLPAQDLAAAVRQLARQGNVQILVTDRAARGRRSNAVKGVMPLGQALAQLLAGTGLAAHETGTGTWALVSSGEAASSRRRHGRPGGRGNHGDRAAHRRAAVEGAGIGGGVPA